MTIEEKCAALYEKASAEQAEYRNWLISQPPEEILNHTHEYTVREDIVMAMEDLEVIGLTEKQLDMLLNLESPLADIYKDYTKIDTQQMDIVRGCIEDRASKELLHEQKKASLRNLPVYPYPASYARENGEIEKYRESYSANVACRDAIREAINENHGADFRFDSRAAVKQVAEKFGYERLLHVCANTIQQKAWDARISPDNIRWAQTVTVLDDKTSFGDNRRMAYVIDNHSTLVDAFVRAARHEYLLTQPLTPEEVKREASNILSQLQNAREPNSPSGTHYAASVSPQFVERAHGKAPEMLGKFLPFQSLAFTTFKDRSGIYAVISQDEDRSKKLKPVRSSVLAKLQKPVAPTSPKHSAKLRKREQER